MSNEDKEKVGENGGATFGVTSGEVETARAEATQAGVSLLTPDLEELAQRIL